MEAEQIINGAEGQWHHLLPPPAAAALSSEIQLRAAPRRQDRCIDLGAGAGVLSVLLSTEVAEVIAIEPSRILRVRLEARAAELGRSNIRTEAVPIAELVMPWQSCDLVISGFALHHCLDVDKRAIVSRIHRWLRPGGRLVIGDMMPDRPAPAGRRPLRSRGTDHHARGRIDHSSGRFFRTTMHAWREMPATGEFWLQAFEDAGYRSLGHRQLLPGVGVVWGVVEPG
ncbi:class I SAM-dependent methyltransferase [Spirillospora sp. CA-142024]|uniref:class I SAM-dependent methyltransferase n=1 Tax=Spirillospora sp. CA-142024 TaxID=3240036 RepID=UPI003D8DBD40